MSDISEQRRLAAIMFTDMVGYSALSQRDERLALELLEQHRTLVRALIARFEGIEIKTIGDAFLVEFRSALDAARCAIEIQRALAKRNFDVPDDRRIELKIGIHVGDVVHRDGDVYGDGVNIASRIEPLAAAGGICVSMDVTRQIRQSLDARFEKIPPVRLKNIKTPMDLYRIILPWEKGADEDADGGNMHAANAEKKDSEEKATFDNSGVNGPSTNMNRPSAGSYQLRWIILLFAIAIGLMAGFIHARKKAALTSASAETLALGSSLGYLQSGGWKGYLWTAVGGKGTITPTNFETTRHFPICAQGVVQAGYTNTAMLGWNINQSNQGAHGGEVLAVPPQWNGVSFRVRNPGHSELRLQIQGPNGGTDPNDRWCASIVTANGFIPFSAFNTHCWEAGLGIPYSGQPISSIALIVPGRQSESTSFDFCIEALAESNQ